MGLEFTLALLALVYIGGAIFFSVLLYDAFSGWAESIEERREALRKRQERLDRDGY